MDWKETLKEILWNILAIIWMIFSILYFWLMPLGWIWNIIIYLFMVGIISCIADSS
jgi:hypothetical protein